MTSETNTLRVMGNSFSYSTTVALRARPTHGLERLRHRAGFGGPDLAGVLGDGAVAGEPSGAGDVENGLARPVVRPGIELHQPPVRFEIGGEVGKMHVLVATPQDVAQRLEDARLLAAEMVGEDHIERLMGLGLVVVVPLRAVPAAAVCHLLRVQPEQEEVLLARRLRHFYGGAVA